MPHQLTIRMKASVPLFGENAGLISPIDFGVGKVSLRFSRVPSERENRLKGSWRKACRR